MKTTTLLLCVALTCQVYSTKLLAEFDTPAPSTLLNAEPVDPTDPGENKSLACPREYYFCGATAGGKNVCCVSKNDCLVDPTDSTKISCKSSFQGPGFIGCGAGAFRCNQTCCPVTQSCIDKDSKCQSKCQDGVAQCPVNGQLGCCQKPEEQCVMKPGSDGKPTYSCEVPPSEASRCTAPTFPCSATGNLNDPFPGTACCNPGWWCLKKDDKNATCCPAGYGSLGGCLPIGPACNNKPFKNCPLGLVCCPDGSTCALDQKGCPQSPAPAQ